MASNSGIDGKVVVGSDTVLNINEWAIDIKHNVQDDTEFTDTWESKLKGLLGAGGNFKGCLDYADTNGQVALHTAMLGTTTVELKLYYSTTGYYSLTAFLTDLKSSNKVDCIVEVDYGFVVTGAVTIS